MQVKKFIVTKIYNKTTICLGRGINCAILPIRTKSAAVHDFDSLAIYNKISYETCLVQSVGTYLFFILGSVYGGSPIINI